MIIRKSDSLTLAWAKYLYLEKRPFSIFCKKWEMGETIHCTVSKKKRWIKSIKCSIVRFLYKWIKINQTHTIKEWLKGKEEGDDWKNEVEQKGKGCHDMHMFNENSGTPGQQSKPMGEWQQQS